MDVETITVDPEAAREKLEHFRRLRPSQLTEDDLVAMAGYEALAAGNPVIDLIAAMKAAGLDNKMPRLAVARADRKAVVFSGHWDGSGIFDPRQERDRYIIVNSGMRFPRGTWDCGNWMFGDYFKSACLPAIPAEHRPTPVQLARYYVLWEPKWEPLPMSPPPVGAFLLKHLDGATFVILAQWDLTPLGQAILRGRISGENRP